MYCIGGVVLADCGTVAVDKLTAGAGKVNP